MHIFIWIIIHHQSINKTFNHKTSIVSQLTLQFFAHCFLTSYRVHVFLVETANEDVLFSLQSHKNGYSANKITWTFRLETKTTTKTQKPETIESIVFLYLNNAIKKLWVYDLIKMLPLHGCLFDLLSFYTKRQTEKKNVSVIRTYFFLFPFEAD